MLWRDESKTKQMEATPHHCINLGRTVPKLTMSHGVQKLLDVPSEALSSSQTGGVACGRYGQENPKC